MELYPPIEPNDSGWLRGDRDHKLYWEKCGNSIGIPVLILHGGPGAGGNKVLRRFFNPIKFNIIIFDQRGAGRSLPNASIKNNTTQYLIEDIEILRKYLNIEKWVIFGGSWGSSLALAYAQKYNKNVLSMILRGIFLCSREEVEWFLYKMKIIFPDYWDNFVSILNKKEKKDILKSYHSRLINPDPKIHLEAAIAWARYEANCSTLLPNASKSIKFRDTKMALSLSRIEAHYFLNNLFLEKDQILKNIHKIRHIPGLIIQGRYDVICPPENAFALHKEWENSQLKIVEKAGHSAIDKNIQEMLLKTMVELKV